MQKSFWWRQRSVRYTYFPHFLGSQSPPVPLRRQMSNDTCRRGGGGGGGQSGTERDSGSQDGAARCFDWRATAVDGRMHYAAALRALCVNSSPLTARGCRSTCRQTTASFNSSRGHGPSRATAVIPLQQGADMVTSGGPPSSLKFSF